MYKQSQTSLGESWSCSKSCYAFHPNGCRGGLGERQLPHLHQEQTLHHTQPHAHESCGTATPLWGHSPSTHCRRVNPFLLGGGHPAPHSHVVLTPLFPQ